MADKTQNVKTRLSFDGEAEYKAACKEINSTLKNNKDIAAKSACGTPQALILYAERQEI